MTVGNLAQTLGVYYGAAFLQGVCLVFTPAAGAYFQSENGVDDTRYGLLIIGQFVGVFCATLPIRHVIARFGRRRVYYAGLISNVAFALALYLTRFFPGQADASFGLLCLANCFLGLGFGWSVSILNVEVVSLIPERGDALLTGLHTSMGVGAALSPQLIGAAHSVGTWQLAPGATALAVLCLLPLSALLLAPAPREASGATTRANAGALPWGARLFLLAVFVYGLIEAVVAYWTPKYLIARGVTDAEARLALSLFWLCVTLGRLGAVALTSVLSARLLYALAPPLALAVFAVIFQTENNLPLWFGALGLAVAYIFPFSISLSVRSYPEHGDRLSGLALLLLLSAYVAANFALGGVRGALGLDIGTAFLVAPAAALVLGALAVGLARRPAVRARSDQH